MPGCLPIIFVVAFLTAAPCSLGLSACRRILRRLADSQTLALRLRAVAEELDRTTLARRGIQQRPALIEQNNLGRPCNAVAR